MTSVQKRGRACVACASIKIKCQLGSDTSLQPPCERCVRLNKECHILAPKRQKDRVAELEAQVANLTRLLKAQGIDNPEAATPGDLRDASTSVSSPPSSTVAATASFSKKRRLDGTNSEALRTTRSPPTSTSLSVSAASTETFNADTFKLDQILPYELQQHLLDRYLDHISPSFPFVPITGDCSLDSLRRHRPILLQSVMYAAGVGILTYDMQEDIAHLLLNRIAAIALTQVEKNLELVQAIHIVCIWYRTPRHHRHVAVYQLIQLASSLAADIGIDGPLTTPGMHFTIEGGNLDGTECWRAWLSCYCMSAAMSIFLRRENSTTWTEQHEQCLIYLPASPVALPSDKWLGQFFRAERLCGQIAEILEFHDMYACHDISEPDTKSKLQSCRNLILNWRISIPQSLRTPLITFWEHLASAYMFESVLHTITNKQSFTAPYVSERLSLTDFPAPVVTQDHITAVYELISATHAMIDIFVAFETPTLIALSGLFVASRAAYANYLLAKLYIATTVPGNTLGSIVDASIIRAEEYNNKLVDASSRVSTVDVRCSCARILGSANRMREWYASYNASLYSDGGLLNAAAGLQFDSYLAGNALPPVDGTGSTSQKETEWETFFRFSDSAADFGLDILFTEPVPSGIDAAVMGMPFDEHIQK